MGEYWCNFQKILRIDAHKKIMQVTLQFCVEKTAGQLLSSHANTILKYFIILFNARNKFQPTIYWQAKLHKNPT